MSAAARRWAAGAGERVLGAAAGVLGVALVLGLATALAVPRVALRP